MMIGMTKWLPIVLCALLCGCATDQTRRQAIDDAHEQMRQSRAERIHARDQRMWDDRDMWLR